MSAQLPSEKPWYFSLALGFSAWFAGILLLIGFGLLLRPESTVEFLTIGALLIGISFALLTFAKDREFLQQLALCLSIAGQCLLIAGIFDQSISAGNLVLSCFILQVLLTIVMPSRIHRSMSALFAIIAWALWCRSLTQGGDFSQLFWTSNAQTSLLKSTGSPYLGWALTWLPVIALCWILMKQIAGRHWMAIFNPILRGVLIGLASASFISNFGAIFGEIGAGGIAIWSLLSAAAAFVALVFSFMLHSKPLMGFCVACMLSHLVHFYYALGTTLLWKSVLMLAIGIICLVTQQLLKQHFARKNSAAMARDL